MGAVADSLPLLEILVLNPINCPKESGAAHFLLLPFQVGPSLIGRPPIGLKTILLRDVMAFIGKEFRLAASLPREGQSWELMASMSARSQDETLPQAGYLSNQILATI